MVKALSVSLFGMFLAIIIPPARKDKVVLVLIIISFAASYLCSRLTVIRDISSGTRTIILTLIIAGIAAWRFPPQTEITPENADAQKNRGQMYEWKYLYLHCNRSDHQLSDPRASADADPQADQNRFIRSFLYYVPYVTLAVMTFPAIIDATATPLAGALALIAGIFMAWKGLGLFPVAIACCIIAYLGGLIF